MEIEISIALILLLLLTLLASVDMAFSQLSDVSLRRLFSDTEDKGSSKTIDFLREVSENRPRFRFSLSSAIQILLIFFSVIIVLIVYRYTGAPRKMFLYSVGIGLSLSVVFRQIIPRIVTWSNPEGRLLLLLPLVRPLYALLPLIADPFEPSFRGRNQITNESSGKSEGDEDKQDDDSSDDIQALIEVGEAEGIIEVEEREMIEKMIEFSDTEVDEIMTPRTDICGVPFDATVTEVRDLMVASKYSRLPVYRDNIDNIEGVIYIRDILNAWADGKTSGQVLQLARTANFVPETKSVSTLLEDMQRERIQISIVVDEFGGVAGLVTVEDILEEIVGEIEDEDQEGEALEIEADVDGYWLVPGSTEIGKIEKHFDCEIEDEDFTTIAGLVTSEAGYVPKRGEKLNVRSLEVEVVKADAKKIHLLRLKKLEDI
ncbi:MAG: hemolysin family protein [Pyrinomonadaceae bacterium]